MRKAAPLAALLVAAPLLAGCTGTAGEDIAELSGGAGTLDAQPAWRLDLDAYGLVTFDATLDGRRVAMGMVQGAQYQGAVYVFDAATGNVLMSDSYPFELCCAFPPVAITDAGDRVAAGGNDVRLYNAESGDLLTSLELVEDGEEWPEVPVNVDVTSDGQHVVFPTWAANRLIALDADGQVLWTARFGEGDEFAEARYSDDGQSVVLSSYGQLTQHDAETGDVLVRYELPTGAESGMPSVAASEDASLVVALKRIDESLAVVAYAPDWPQPQWVHSLGADEYLGGVHVTPGAGLVGAWSPAGSVILDASGSPVARFDEARLRAFVPIPTGVLVLVDDGESLRVVHVAKGLRWSHGAIPQPEDFSDATLTRHGILTVSVPREDRKPVGTIVELYPIADLPFEGVAHHGG